MATNDGGEINALLDLLEVENTLNSHGNPFRCQDIECCRYGQKLWAGDCQCYDMQAREHREKVRAAIRAREAS